VSGFHLTVDHAESFLLQVTDQVGKGDLGSIGTPGKHGFSIKHAAQRNSIQPPDQLAIHPGFD